MNGKQFKVKSPGGDSVKNILMGRPKYISLDELCKPAQVTDRLRRDFSDLKQYDRNSMKNAVRKMLQTNEIKGAVIQFWDGDGTNGLEGGDEASEDGLVSDVSNGKYMVK